MAKTMIEVDKNTRNELRSFKADRGMTYDEAIRTLLESDSWEFRHTDPTEGSP